MEVHFMNRMSARFVAQKAGISTEWVYALWYDMGIVTKDKFGDWILTDAGKKSVVKCQKNNHRSVPTFDFDTIEKLMIDYHNKNR